MAAARCLGGCALEARPSLAMTSCSEPVPVRSGAEEGASWQQPGAVESARLKLTRAWAWPRAVRLCWCAVVSRRAHHGSSPVPWRVHA